MQIRYNIFFIPLLIIASVLVWYVGVREETKQAANRLSDRVLLDVSKLDVIELIRPDETIRLERTNPGGEGAGTADDWRIKQPFDGGCHPRVLAELIESIQSAEIEREFPDVTPEQQAEYGLSEPELRLRLASSSGDLLMDLSIGLENPSGASRYAAFTGKPQTCFLVPIYHIEPFEVTANDLRDGRAIAFNPDDLEAIQISSVVADIHFRKQDATWMITSPRHFAANPSRLDILLHDIRELEVVEFLPEDAADPELRTVFLEAHFAWADGSQEFLILHGEDYSRGIFATSSYQPSPFIVEAYISERLAVNPNVFFHVTLIDFPRADFHRVHVRQPNADNLEIERTGDGPGDWRVLRPHDRDLVDPGDFENFINALLALQPEVGVDHPRRSGDYGIDPVYYMMVEIHPKSGEQHAEIYLGSRDLQGNYYATTDGNSYFTIHSRMVQNFIEATNKLRGSTP